MTKGRWDYIEKQSADIINAALQNFTPHPHKSTHWELLQSLSEQTGETIMNIIHQAKSSADAKKITPYSLNLRPYAGAKRNVTRELLLEIAAKIEGEVHLQTKVKVIAEYCGFRVHEKFLEKTVKNGN